MNKCWLGLHTYEVYKEEDIKNLRDDIIGKAIISRCSECGKINIKRIITVQSTLDR